MSNNVTTFVSSGKLMKSIIDLTEKDYFKKFHSELGEKLDISNVKFVPGKDFTATNLKLKLTVKNTNVDIIEFIKKFKIILEHIFENQEEIHNKEVIVLRIDCTSESVHKYSKFDKETETIDYYQKVIFSVSIILK